MARLRRRPCLARSRPRPRAAAIATCAPDQEESRVTVLTTTLDSPLGPLFIAAGDTALHAIEFRRNRHRVRRGDDWREGDSPLLRRARQQLEEYFAGRRRVFDLPLAPRGTAFQREVWHALALIPYGATISYAELAARVGRPTAVRAVGAANGRNPLPIVLPCHRVIGADGSLTGFGGGLPAKQYLLKLEGALPDTFDLFPLAVA
ncbi:MAG: methylated-DNA--[protein]-cysteine S-methyltransferase [Xanthomonadaceae bacterium]|nr:methylated-DNA--[protein]-cysteine S-methyltransferase [Xanthomonadaceae bacterium]